MPEPVASIARRSASRLAEELGQDLPALMERSLARGGEGEEPARYDGGASIALAALVLSAVQFAWQVYRDIKKDREKKSDEREPREVLLRRLRLKVKAPPSLGIERRDRILEIVTEEVLVEAASRG